jgi:peroxin-11B
MGITTASWGPRVTQESNKFWFYALSISILLSLYHLWTAASLFEKPAASTTTKEVETKPSEKESSRQLAGHKPAVKTTPKVDTSQVYKQLIIDCSDLFIPGAIVGWIPADPVVVGVAMAISSIVAGRDIWIKVNGSRSVTT